MCKFDQENISDRQKQNKMSTHIKRTLCTIKLNQKHITSTTKSNRNDIFA